MDPMRRLNVLGKSQYDNAASDFYTRKFGKVGVNPSWDRFLEALKQKEEEATAAGMKFEVGFQNLGDLKEADETRKLTQQAATGDRGAVNWLKQRESLSRAGTGVGRSAGTDEQAVAFGAAHFSPKGEAALNKQFQEQQQQQQGQEQRAERTAALRQAGLPMDYNLDNPFATGPGSMRDAWLQEEYRKRGLRDQAAAMQDAITQHPGFIGRG